MNVDRDILEIFIKGFSSVEKAAKKIGIPRETLSAIRSGRNQMQVEFAVLIADYLERHKNIKVSFADLLSSDKKNKFKKIRLNFNDPFLTLCNILLSDVKHHTKTEWISEELSDLDTARPIIIDENNQLIGNYITYFLHIQNQKVTICAWKISLYDLINGKFETSYLTKIFDEVELGYIGIALKKIIGNCEGQYSNLFENKPNELCLNQDEVMEETDQFIANLLGCPSTHYQQITNIILHCSDELIEKVRAKKITIAVATLCLPFLKL